VEGKQFFVHEKALCESDTIGSRTRVWAFCHIMKDAVIGEDCNFGDGSFVESGVRIGNRVTVKNGVCIWHGVTIEDDVFLGPNCVLTNDLYPRSRVYLSDDVPTLIKQGATIGANATIVAGVTLGKYCMIGAGSVVNKDVKDFNLVVGNPFRVIGFVGVRGEKLDLKNDGDIFENENGIYKLEQGDISFTPVAA